MIRRVIELANQAPLDDATVVSRAEAWADAMWGVIPEDRLLDSFTQAVRFHDTVYPINAHEVLLAWKEIADSEAKLAEKNRFETIRDRALEAPQYEDCRYCHGCGFKPAKPKDGFPGVQLCYECAYWIRRDAERELNRNRKVAR